jgi:hypothetical protein
MIPPSPTANALDEELTQTPARLLFVLLVIVLQTLRIEPASLIDDVSGFIELVGPEQAIIEGRHINSTKNSMSNFFKVLSPANNMLFRRSFLHDNIP